MGEGESVCPGGDVADESCQPELEGDFLNTLDLFE